MERFRVRWMDRSAAAAQLLPEFAAKGCRGGAAWKQPVVARQPGSRQRGRQGRRVLRALLAGFAILLSLHLASTLSSAWLHFLAPPSAAGLSDLLQLSGDGEPAAAARYYSEPHSTPKLIPRIIHQTYKTRQMPDAVRAYMRTWHESNPGWEVRFYDDQDCAEFVRREFPEYLDAYRRLRKDVERSDFFRYMVVLRHGGVYADIDTECRRPLDDLLRSRDTLVVGWENEFASGKAAVDAWYVRTRQLLQWVFAGAAGHPALREVCDSIAASLRTPFSTDSNIDTLERTGPGVFTDAVLRHAAAHPPARRDDPWSVRVLPRVAFGTPHKAAYGLRPGDPSVAVQHHFLGSWRLPRRWWRFWGRGDVEDVAAQTSRRWLHRSVGAAAAQAERLEAAHAERQLYPVSADFDPPFDVMTHLVSHGERQSGWDVSAALTAHGAWQPSVQPTRRPSLADAVVGSLGGRGASGGGAEAGAGGALVDVGAGYGFISLAAAARGHRVHAFELGPGSLVALEASIAHNGFEHLIRVHRTPLGAPEQRGRACLEVHPNASEAAPAATAERLDLARGYSAPAAHALPAAACARAAVRLSGASAIPPGERVAAVRVSANGWEGFVVEGFLPLIQQQRPPVIAVEWNPAAMRAVGYSAPLDLLHSLVSLGYEDVSHSGFVCDERWYSITYGVRRRGGVTPEDLAGLKQPTWCRLLAEDYSLLLERASSKYPETLLFINKAAGRAAGGDGAAAAADSGNDLVPRAGAASAAGSSGGASARGKAANEAAVGRADSSSSSSSTATSSDSLSALRSEAGRAVALRQARVKAARAAAEADAVAADAVALETDSAAHSTAQAVSDLAASSQVRSLHGGKQPKVT